MSLLAQGTFSNVSSVLYAPVGSGGGGSTSTLQSPASITPDGTQTATLELGNNGTVNSSIVLNNDLAGASFVQLEYVKLVHNAYSQTLSVQNSITGLAPLSVDTTGNAVGIGAVGGTVSVNTPLTLSSPSKATFVPTTVTSTGGAWIAGDNTIALGGFARGMYVIYGDTGGATTPIDLECRPISIFVIDPATTVSGGGSGSVTNWNMSPNGTGGLTLNLTNAPSSAFSMKVMPLYVF
jgi:hypothetical protein